MIDTSKLIKETIASIKPVNKGFIEKANSRLDNLTKPRGSLGKLETIAAKLVAMTENVRPTIEKKAVFVFASDHGITEEGVSAYPKEVTAQMVLNFLNNGAAINAIAKQNKADVYVADIGVDYEFPELDNLISIKINNGTNNFLKEPAMTSEQAIQSIEAGIKLAQNATKDVYSLIATGEMGIGNTTSAAAVISICLDMEASDIVGYGTGIDKETWILKVETVESAVSKYKKKNTTPIEILSCVGGYEIGGITGLLLGCAANRIPVIVDGFISTAAACLAIQICPYIKEYMFFGHISAEKGHRLAMKKIEAEPILDMDLRLGEGTGAVLAMPLIEAALSAYNNMNTFEEAAVTSKKSLD